jgi:transcriptional regulator with XRE-family HTH domain
MDDRNALGTAVGARLRALRQARGVTLSALAREAGLGKGTLSELESGRRNPTLETLFAVTTALGLPLSAALPEDEAGPDASGAAVDAWLVERLDAAEVFRLRIRAGAIQVSAPHARGVEEQVLVVAGRLRLGSDAAVLGPGESLSYAGDRPHVWEALDADVSAVLVMRYP